ncbi:hypothetical protein DHEL01_v208374 [Diaporthe helianthi]|uniref:Uncharacterized protein n=1 Tax=Diaporthe helianthi TaxID=158607 RepID=A0A2P5HSJ3_DIAHE|nr:hypothetical protein DHEL01_v208374 [Diaporthe helianthi]
MAEVQAQQPVDAQHAPAGTAPQETVPEQEKPTTPAALYLGDNLIPDAEMVYDQKRTINAPPEDIWPWLVQWGKDRGGWYLPAKVEKILPEKFRSTPTIVPKWQTLKVGDSVPDYGLGTTGKDKKESGHSIEVAMIESDRALVYKGERAGVTFTWALLLETPAGAPAGTTQSEAASTASATETVLHLRFRGKSNQTGWKGKVAVQVAKVSDAVMASAIFPGIADRVEPKSEKAKKMKDVA